MNNNKDFYTDGTSSDNEKFTIPKRWFFSRILCFIIAFGIWIYVVNITTQDAEKTFNLIDISIDGRQALEDATNMSVVNLEESKVSITVKGLRSDISKLTEKDFSAYIDVSRLKDVGKHSLEVFVDLPSTVSLVSRYPETVIVSVDENIEKTIPLDIDVTEYNIDTIYEMGQPVADVTDVVVTGPSDILKTIKEAKAYIKLGTVMTSMVIRTEIVLVDKAGNSINTTFLTMDNTSVTVTVPVTMEKNVPLVCDYALGVDSSAYSSVSVSQETVKLKGDPKILNDLDKIVVYSLNGSEDAPVSVDFATLDIPHGVTVIDAPGVILITPVIAEETTNTQTDPIETQSGDATEAGHVNEEDDGQY